MDSNMSTAVKKILFIEGNIGAGKSTLIEELKRTMDEVYDFTYSDEPIGVLDSVIDMGDGRTPKLLETLYNDEYKNFKSFKFMAQELMLNARISALEKIASLPAGNKTFVIERSPHSCVYVFGEIMKDEGQITSNEYKHLKTMLSTRLDVLDDVLQYEFKFVDLRPDLCLTRVKSRSRNGEDSISSDFLGKVHNAQEKFKQRKLCFLAD